MSSLTGTFVGTGVVTLGQLYANPPLAVIFLSIRWSMCSSFAFSRSARSRALLECFDEKIELASESTPR
jgi:hypothetical protein